MHVATRFGLAFLSAAALMTSVHAGVPLSATLLTDDVDAPMHVMHAPGDDSGRLFIIEREGLVRIWDGSAMLATPFLDVIDPVTTTGEGGLLGMAFHPDYQSNGKFYLNYTTAAGGLATIIAQYTVSSDPNVADPDSFVQVIRIEQAPATNHKAGWLGFGPDGYLYIPLGDGGASADTAQDLTDQLLGKLLRLDVNGDDFPADDGRNYAIPADNPYVGVEGDDEIFAYGFRNPYRAGFDRLTGDLWIGDVGASSREEVGVLPAGARGGGNFGWPCMEGFLCYEPRCGCEHPDIVLPVYDYDHSVGCVVTGGTVYRGCAMPELQGTYFFADNCTSRVWSFRSVGGVVTEFQERTTELQSGGESLSGPVAFGEDFFGELYIVNLFSSEILKIVPATPGPDSDGDGVPDSCEAASPDLNGDGDVDGFDLALLLGQWGPCRTPGKCPADLDGNGVVNGFDLALLLGDWS